MYGHGNLQPKRPVVHQRHGEEQRDLDDPPSERDHPRLEPGNPVSSALLARGRGKGELGRERFKCDVEELDERKEDAWDRKY